MKEELQKKLQQLTDERLDIDIARESENKFTDLDLSEGYYNHLEDEIEETAELLELSGVIVRRTLEEVMQNPKVVKLLEYVDYGKHGDLRGSVWGALTITDYSRTRVDLIGRSTHYWVSTCACGECHIVSTHQLVNQGLRDCGCNISNEESFIKTLELACEPIEKGNE